MSSQNSLMTMTSTPPPRRMKKWKQPRYMETGKVFMYDGRLKGSAIYYMGNCTGCLTAGIASIPCHQCNLNKTYQAIEVDGLYCNPINLASDYDTKVIHHDPNKLMSEYGDPCDQEYEAVQMNERQFLEMIEAADAYNQRQAEDDEEPLVCGFHRDHDEYWISTSMNGPHQGKSRMF